MLPVRPNSYMMAYAGIHNAYDIHRRCLPNRTFLGCASFLCTRTEWTPSYEALPSFVQAKPCEGGIFIRGRVKFFAERMFRLPTKLEATSPDA